jgi:hypothetical protein
MKLFEKDILYGPYYHTKKEFLMDLIPGYPLIKRLMELG